MAFRDSFLVVPILVMSLCSRAESQTLKDLLGGKNKINADVTKKIGESIGVGSPLLLDQNTAFAEYPQQVLNFNPKPYGIYTSADLDRPLAPGDYAVQVMFYCSEWSIHCPGRGIPYKLSRIQGRLAPAIGALFARGSLQKIDPGSLNATAWRLEDGMSLQQMPPQDQARIHSLIPDYEKDLQGDYLAKVQQSYDKFKLIPGAPTFESVLTKLGPVGQSFMELERARNTLANQTVSDERLPDMLYQPKGDGLPRVLPDAKDPKESPWAEIYPGVIGRFTDVGGYLQANLLEIRVFPQATSALRLASWSPPAAAPSLSDAMGLSDVRAANTGTAGNMTLPLNAYPIGAGAQIPTLTPIISCPSNAIGNLPNLKTAAQKAEAQKLSYELMGALAQLEKYRADFLNNADYIDLFPAMYADTTAADMSRIANGDYQYPIEHMQQMLDFFDAYQSNRVNWDTNHTAEPQWAAQFQQSEDAGKTGTLSGITVMNILNSGVDAHVNYDLARALRDSYNNRYDQNLTAADLKPDFMLTDSTFPADAAQKLADIQAAAKNSNVWNQFLLNPTMAGFGDWLFNETSTVIKERHKAWDDAMGKGDLATGYGKQPTTDHDKLLKDGMAYCK